jgi:hypothetical protein
LIAQLYYFWGGNQMAGGDGIRGNNQSRNAKVRRRRVVIMGGAVGAFLAAAAMATGSAVTAAPAKADFDDLLDPIIQPLVTSLSDAIAGFDPAAATDLTSWTDSLLNSLNSIDLALPSTAEPAASAAQSTGDSPTSGTYDIPITVQEDTEPTVQATVDGESTQLLVDTGSSGLVIPYTDLGSSTLQQLENLIELGLPTGINTSGYSGGVEYLYLEYNDVSTDYGNGTLDTTGPVDVEVYSWDPNDLSSLFTNDAFQNFLSDNDSTGILGIGDNAAGPTESPLEADGYDGVTVDIPGSDGNGPDLIVDPSNPFTAIATVDGPATVDGAPTSTLYESINNGTPVQVSDDVDSGGVFGTIPSTLESGSSVPSGTTSSGYDNAAGTGTPLYTYQTGDLGNSGYDGPAVVTGNSIDSGVEPYLEEPIYINYTDDTLTFDQN